MPILVSRILLAGPQEQGVAYIHDLSEHQRAERWVHVQHACTAVLAHASDLSEAARQLLQEVCDRLGWKGGAIWTVDPAAGGLRCFHARSATGHDDELSRTNGPLTFPRGEGLLGRVWAEGNLIAVNDLSAHADTRPGFAAVLEDCQSWIGIPLHFGSDFFGVLEFFSHEESKPDAAAQAVLLALGSQIGQFLERKRSEQALRESERHLRAIIEATPECVKLMAVDGALLQMNAAGLRMIQAETPDQVLGRKVFGLIAPEERDDYRSFHDNVCRGQGGTLTFHIIGLKGRRLHLETEAVPLLRADGTTVHLAITRDVTHKGELEEQVRKAQKMEAVGRLAGGVAHDFNNLLTIINGYSELLLQMLPPGDSLRDLVQEIKRAGDRSASLTRQLLAFSRKQIVTAQVLDLNALVSDAEKMLRRMIGEDIELTTVLGTDLGSVRADPGQIEQVLLNLAVNARDAMPQGGKLTIETKNVSVDESYAESHFEVRPGPYVRLVVSDTGCGMTAEVLEHLYEPFFSTKGPGRGTGLGLSVIHGIVKQSGGFISVYSEPGMGTSFKILLPRVDKPVRTTPSLHGIKVLPQGSETILLAEDDPAVRALTAHILRGCGYRLLEASDVKSALEAAGVHQGPIDILVTDVVMPGGGGRELAEALAPGHSGMKVLYLSGYTDDAVVRHGILHDEVNFLQKPFSPLVLAHKVRQILDA